MTLRIFLLLSLLGCDGPPTAESDAGFIKPFDGAEPYMEIGIGEGAFSSFEEGATLSLVCGGQGLQHVWTALRAWGIDPRHTILSMSLRRDEDQEIVSQAFSVRVSMRSVPGESYVEVSGLTLVVPEPDRAIDEDLTLRVTIEPRDGGGPMLVSERDIRLQWEIPEGCIPQG